MIIVRPGHLYSLDNYEDKAQGQFLQFIEKMPIVGMDKLQTVKDGTTNEEVFLVLIDRLQHINSKLPSRETSVAITKLEEALMWCEKRSRDRARRGVEGTALK